MSKPSIAPRLNLAPSPLATSPSGNSGPSISLSTSAASGGISPPALVKLNSGIITSKEWVLPPRPKPGRKPSVDTPASKRKAQNRAAQRAFRERRATRVQELEERLMEVEKERDVKEMGLINTINKLKVENQYLMKSLDLLKFEVQSLKKSNNNDNSTHPSPMNHMNSTSPASSVYSVQQISPAASTSADSPPNFTSSNNFLPTANSRRSKSNSGHHIHYPFNNHHHNKQHNHPVDSQAPEKADASFDCGVCLKDDCLCESVGIKEKESLEDTINKFKPMQAVSLKKRKSSSQEVDFTTKFVKKPLPDFKKLRHHNSSVKEEPKEFNESSPVDNCGFCSDDTPCVCREAAKEAAKLNQSLNEDQAEGDDFDDSDDDQTALPPIQINSSGFRKSSLPVMHPGPSVDIRDITNLTPGAVPAVMTPNAKMSDSNKSKSKSGCTGNPGTCEQCQMDPMSTLFCTTVASKAKESNERSSSVSTVSMRTSHERGSPKNGSNDDNENESSSTPNTMNSAGTNSSSESESTSSGFPDSETLDSKSRYHSRTSSSVPVSSGENQELPSVDSIKSTVSTPVAGPSTPSAAVTPSSSDMFIPCADAYKTLSRHKKFNSVDFSTLVGKLTTRGMQVEVQSVANVLRELDRRLYN